MERNSPPSRPQSLGRHVNFAASATSALCNKLLAQHDLALQQWVVLSALSQKDKLSVSEIAAYTSSAGPAASRILDRMVEKELIGWRPTQDDRRFSTIFLTEKGNALRHLQSFDKDVNANLLGGMSESEAETLYSLLQQVTDSARQFVERGE